jgi:hypothetical protein
MANNYSFEDDDEEEDDPRLKKVDDIHTPEAMIINPQLEEQMHEESWFIFVPKGKNMFTSYPELKDVPEFKAIGNEEMKFVWMIGNRTSSMFIDDLSNTSNFGRLKIAVEKAFGKNVDPKIYRDYTTGAFSIEVKMAYERMKVYDPAIRIRSTMMIDKVFARWEKIAGQKMDDKEYIDITSKIIDKLPDLIRLKESRFGASEKKDTDKKQNLMDLVMDLQK